MVLPSVKVCEFPSTRHAHTGLTAPNPCEYIRGVTSVRMQCDMPCTHLPVPGRISNNHHEMSHESVTPCELETTHHARTANPLESPQRRASCTHSKRHTMHRKRARHAHASNSPTIGTPCSMKCASHAHRERRGMHTPHNLPTFHIVTHHRHTKCARCVNPRRHAMHTPWNPLSF